MSTAKQGFSRRGFLGSSVAAAVGGLSTGALPIRLRAAQTQGMPSVALPLQKGLPVTLLVPAGMGYVSLLEVSPSTVTVTEAPSATGSPTSVLSLAVSCAFTARVSSPSRDSS